MSRLDIHYYVSNCRCTDIVAFPYRRQYCVQLGTKLRTKLVKLGRIYLAPSQYNTPTYACQNHNIYWISVSAMTYKSVIQRGSRHIQIHCEIQKVNTIGRAGVSLPHNT